MKVLKRDGDLEEVSFDKITYRISEFLNEPSTKKRYLTIKNDLIDPITISQKLCSRLYESIPTSEIDNLTSEICVNMATTHPDFGKLASLIAIDDHQKNTDDDFTEVCKRLYNNINYLSEYCPLISEKIYNLSKKRGDELNNMLDYSRDFILDFFGFKTLCRSYLLKVGNKIIERPQHMWLRVSLGIHGNDFEKVKETYDLMSQGFFTHATPTLFHAGTPRSQMISCYLLATEDSITGIYKNLTDCAKISKWAGGIGVHVSNIRSKNSFIRKTSGFSSGILPMLKVYNDTARYVNQSGRRNGSIAIYIEPWHDDIFEFLDAKKNTGADEERARDLFYALWIPDLFMKRVENDEEWCLMCPDESKGLHECYGEEFNELYKKYEEGKKYKRKVKARDIWQKIIDSQIETGTPYILYKDAANKKSNQQNLGTIKSSNLCSEIIQYSDKNETACCNLASIALSRFIIPPPIPDENITIYTKSDCKYCKLAKILLRNYNISFTSISLDDQETRTKFFDKISKPDMKIHTVPQVYVGDKRLGGYDKLSDMLRPTFDFQKLKEVSQIITRNLNKVIDLNFYPVVESRISNNKHRPLGIGVQGLADTFFKMRYPFDSNDAKKLNKEIHETIYFGSMTESMNLAKKDGEYSSFRDSPLSKGKFQFDLWREETGIESFNSGRWDWENLRENVVEHGVRNSLLVALMPTASTSQILGQNECFEPITSNIYLRRTLAGEFVRINDYLIRDLINLGVWNEEMKEKLMFYRGSIQQINGIPQEIKDLYKTAWELKQKVLIDMSADRGQFVCQSQSLNVFTENPTYKLLTNIHFYGWKKGLKTGTYYIRSKPALNSQSFTLDPNIEKKIKEELNEQEQEVCIACSS